MQVRFAAIAMTIAGTILAGSSASAAELKVLTTGAMKTVVLALVPQFESQGHKSYSTTAPPARCSNASKAGKLSTLP